MVFRIAIIFLLFYGSSLWGWNDGFKNFSRLNWKTTSTKYFYVHYHEGAEQCTARLIKKIDKLYKEASKLVGYNLDEKIHVVVRDDKPVANGEAQFSSDKVEIYCSNLHTPFRGKLYGI